MYNLMKMDLYRLFKATSTKVMLLVVICFSVFVVNMTHIDIESMEISSEEKEMGTVIEDGSISMNFGIYSESKSEWATEDILFAELMETQFASAIFLVILAIFVSLYVYAERKHGFIKNIAGQLTNKWFLVVSKLAAVAVMNLLMFVVIAVVMFISGKVVFGEQLILGSVTDCFKVLGGQYLLHLGFASLVLAMSVLFNSSDLSITFGILLSFRFMTLIYVPISRLKIFGEKNFDISKYAIEMNVTSFSINASQADIIRAMLVAITFIIISGVLAAVAMQKRDIK